MIKFFLFHPKYGTILRYLVSGGLGALSNFGTLYILADIFEMWYLTASIISFIFSVIVSFICQKYLTFRNTSTDFIHRQIITFVILACINVGINTILMYVFVDFFEIWYLLAAIIASALIAVSSFFLYRHFIFHR